MSSPGDDLDRLRDEYLAERYPGDLATEARWAARGRRRWLSPGVLALAASLALILPWAYTSTKPRQATVGARPSLSMRFALPAPSPPRMPALAPASLPSWTALSGMRLPGVSMSPSLDRGFGRRITIDPHAKEDLS